MNSAGIRAFFQMLFVDHSEAIPHFTVSSIAEIDPQWLWDQGVRAVLFDKDNTITAPYVNEIHHSIVPVFTQFRQVFGENCAILSNSAGTDDDTAFADAERIEQAIGIRVIRHSAKKPSGTESVEEWFTVPRSAIVIIGDRVLTDILFGNRAKILTILTDIFTIRGDNIPAAIARTMEMSLLKKWKKGNGKAPAHPLDSITLRPISKESVTR